MKKGWDAGPCGDLYLQVRSWFLGRVTSEHDADDLAQQVLAESVRANATRDPKAYLAGVASKVLSRYRRQKSRERAVLRKLLVEALGDGSARQRDAPQGASDSEESSAKRAVFVEDVLGGLKPAQIKLLKLRFEKGLPVAQVARRIGCSTAAARKRIQRTVKELRQKHGVEAGGRTYRKNPEKP